MYLTTENAHKYVGKTLDSEKRIFHHYPLTVYERNGEYFYKDITETRMRVPEKSDMLNSVWFDFVI